MEQQYYILRERTSEYSNQNPNELDGAISAWIRRYFTPKRAVLVLTFMLFLNYVDRGIVPGAATSIRGCLASEKYCYSDPLISTSLSNLPTDVNLWKFGENTTNSSCVQCRICGTICDGEYVKQTGFGINKLQLSILQSSFMLGFVFGAILFAHLATGFRAFRLVSLGMFFLVIASIGSGLSSFVSISDGNTIFWTYYLMVFMRALSGVGEASITTLALPFLDDILDTKSKGFYIGIYYTAIPVGTACGFIWAGVITSATDGAWGWAFILEAFVMIPFVLLCYHVPDIRSLTTRSNDDNISNSLDNFSDSLSNRLENSITFQALHTNLADNVRAVLSKPAYLFGVASYAIYTGVIAGLGFYGPTFIQDYRSNDPAWHFSQTSADLVFGLVVFLSGLLGTLIGGRLVDRIQTQQSGRKNRNGLVKQLSVQIIVGFILCFLATICTTPALLFLLLFIGCTCLFMVSTGINLMLMWTVPDDNRSMSAALCTLLIHIFGDVPSPILIGFLSDISAPSFTLQITLTFLCVSFFFLQAINLFVTEECVLDRVDEENDRYLEEINALDSQLE